MEASESFSKEDVRAAFEIGYKGLIRKHTILMVVIFIVGLLVGVGLTAALLIK